MKLLLCIYDYFRQHTLIAWLSFVLTVLLLVCLCLNLRFSEDITEFLPLSDLQKQQLSDYERLQNSDRIVVLFEGAETDRLIESVDLFETLLLERHPNWDTLLTAQLDIETYINQLCFVLQNPAFFLTENDYVSLDSMLSDNLFYHNSIEMVKKQMLMPIPTFQARLFPYDPLGLFSNKTAELLRLQTASDGFTHIDGYFFTADSLTALAFLKSPYGANETRQNKFLVEELEKICSSVAGEQHISVRTLGNPVIAVQNATRIKKDTFLTLGISVILIVIVLFTFFRNSKRDILLILLTTAFGYLCGMVAIAVWHKEISLVILGIASVIIGIAVNYPLHLVVHRRYTADTRTTLKEVLLPLVVGNITTIAAFLALLPLNAVAMKELGLFSAAMLLGTIVFSVLWLPQLMKNKTNIQQIALPKWLCHNRKKESPLSVGIKLSVIAVLTIGFYFLGKDIRFDNSLSNINYLTESQKKDFAMFAAKEIERTTAEYMFIQPLADTLPENLVHYLSVNNIPYRSAEQFFPTEKEQQKRIELWNGFIDRYKAVIISNLNSELAKQGFRPLACQPFFETLEKSVKTEKQNYFDAFDRLLLRSYYISDTIVPKKVTYFCPEKQNVGKVVADLKAEAVDVFSANMLQKQITQTLSGSFDYLGIVCSLIVFIFLWLSFRSIRLALIAFLPMAVSWVWILGIMKMFGLQFNIVNIILATFIFGQGDDYTIFITEGLVFENKTGKPVLPQYKMEILLSALFMLIGIGVLVFAKHPAMHSLGSVILVGMAVVVVLASVLPPLLYKLFFPQLNESAKSS